MYYFLFAPNNSGTTVMSQTVARSCGGYLPPFGNHEGQMVPEVKPLMRVDPWSDRPVDFLEVRRVWDRLLAGSDSEIFVEASPPNLMRVDAILAAFPQHRAVFSMCSPWQQIASEVKNYTRPPMSDRIERTTDRWLKKATRQVRNRERFPDIPYVTYEAFCADPRTLTDAFGIEHSDQVVSGKKNSGIRGVRDLSMKTRAFLTLYEAEKISTLLAPHANLLQTLGYDHQDFEALTAQYEAHPAQVHAGGIDRARWEARTAAPRKSLVDRARNRLRRFRGPR